MSETLEEVVSFAYWFDLPSRGATPITFGLGLILAIVTGAIATIYLRRRALFPGQRVIIRAIVTYCPWLIGLGATGVILIALRAVESPILTARSLLAVDLIAFALLAGRAAWYRRTLFPLEQAAFEREDSRARGRPRRGRSKR
ncbi:MAG: hypothetical protein EPO26_00755 [Chloroflexota bacterium]|nr:MAG: hypothetical protein EPO26_00755 [Chloroflexota bacterium]